jgi:hypothetical protein
MIFFCSSSDEGNLSSQVNIPLYSFFLDIGVSKKSPGPCIIIDIEVVVNFWLIDGNFNSYLLLIDI